MGLLFIAATILLTVYGQLVLKWRVGVLFASGIPPIAPDSAAILFRDIWVLSAFAAAFGASLTWIVAISGMPLSRAYPFMALNFVAVIALSGLVFGEVMTLEKVLGAGLIIMGVLLVSRSAY